MEEKIKLFRYSHLAIESELERLKAIYGYDLREGEDWHSDKDEDYYPQFQQHIRDEAASMSQHYELFYCLEKSIRSLIKEKMEAEHGKEWWQSDAIQEDIRKAVEKRQESEKESAVTPRSIEDIDYTTFGELGEIVRKNWEVFGDTFNNLRGFNKVMGQLNALRGPIAHCSPLADDEVLRLTLTLKDWFRLME